MRTLSPVQTQHLVLPATATATATTTATAAAAEVAGAVPTRSQYQTKLRELDDRVRAQAREVQLVRADMTVLEGETQRWKRVVQAEHDAAMALFTQTTASGGGSSGSGSGGGSSSGGGSATSVAFHRQCALLLSNLRSASFSLSLLTEEFGSVQNETRRLEEQVLELEREKRVPERARVARRDWELLLRQQQQHDKESPLPSLPSPSPSSSQQQQPPPPPPSSSEKSPVVLSSSSTINHPLA